ncbi:MAG: site-specific integrase, partial [Rhodospirillales bacterium]|nr:site-specific integrase [Rhodospirillales bacterium]
MTPGDRDAALPAAAVTDALASAAGYAAAEKSEATRKVYRSDLRQFVAWCGSVGRRALPAEAGTCAAFFATLADRGYKAATIARKAAALAYAHRLAGEASPLDLEATKAVLRGVRRTIGTAQACKRPMTADVIGAAVRKLPKTIAG